MEKPLCLNEEELNAIQSEYERHDLHLMVDFNRRFAPHVLEAQKLLHLEVPKAIQYRINAGALPADHWVHDPEVGGGRILGEVCHFVDLVFHLVGSPFKSLSASALRDRSVRIDSLVVNLAFQDGSVASISYFSNGHPSLAKERLEIFSAGQSIVIEDFKKMTVYGAGKARRLKQQDKGNEGALRAFLQAVQTGSPSPIAPQEIWASTEATFKVAESVRTGQPIIL